jgi:RND family efflux transporter MFP subunit
MSRIAAAALLALASLSGAPAAPAADLPFAVQAVTWEAAPRERIWNGTVEAVNQATVSAQTSGRVAEILYDVDDFVEAGAVIIRFTDTEQKAALRQAEGALHEAQARFEEANNELERVTNMYQNETVSKARYDQARANREAASARLEAARSGVTAAQEQVDHTVVRSPYAGIVSKRLVSVGEHVSPGQPLMSGLSLQSLRVNVDVPQSLIDPIRTIGKAFVYTDSQRIAGEHLTFFPIADPATNTFRVRVDLPAGATTLYPGTFVKVGFVIGETQRLLVPESAVVHRSELTAVYVVADDGRVSLRQIRTGHRYGERLEVLSGLDSGEQIALDPVRAGVYVKEHAQADLRSMARE